MEYIVRIRRHRTHLTEFAAQWEQIYGVRVSCHLIVLPDPTGLPCPRPSPVLCSSIQANSLLCEFSPSLTRAPTLEPILSLAPQRRAFRATFSAAIPNRLRRSLVSSAESWSLFKKNKKPMRSGEHGGQKKAYRKRNM